jgi:filamentous hemagglutinin family protein
MNRNNYRLVFNATSGMQVPVAETARGRGKTARGSARALAGAVLASVVLAAPAWADLAANALPAGAVVKSGSIGIAQSGNTLNINQASQTGIIHWNSFNIGSGATVNFNQPNVTAATLNRITGNEASIIKGAMNATGAVYVINRNGIVFDKGAQVNLHTLVASTLDIKDDELFKNGFLTADHQVAAFSDAYTQYVGTAPVGMVNVAEGATITAATGGRVILLAPDVENKGIIKTDTGQVILAAGHKAYFHLTNSSDSSTLLRGLLVEVESGGSAVNLGELAARQGDVTLIGKLVKQDGVITATTSANLNGTIHLLAR